MSTITAPLGALRRSLAFPLDTVEWRQAENGRSDDYTLRGHAAVFNALSDDLGGFKELLEPGAFRAALRSQPDVRLLFGHNSDTLIPLARTKSGTLELREDTTGLHVWARVAPTSFANDMRIAMQRGDLDQMSFAFTIRENGDDWAVADDGQVVRTIRADGVEGLFDVSVVTYPAYTQTDAAMRELRNAVSLGRLPATVLGEPNENDTSAQNPDSAAGDTSRSTPAGDEAHKRLLALRARARAAVTTNQKENDK
jgi:HK97 family phage prohead protease